MLSKGAQGSNSRNGATIEKVTFAKASEKVTSSRCHLVDKLVWKKVIFVPYIDSGYQPIKVSTENIETGVGSLESKLQTVLSLHGDPKECGLPLSYGLLKPVCLMLETNAQGIVMKLTAHSWIPAFLHHEVLMAVTKHNMLFRTAGLPSQAISHHGSPQVIPGHPLAQDRGWKGGMNGKTTGWKGLVVSAAIVPTISSSPSRP